MWLHCCCAILCNTLATFLKRCFPQIGLSWEVLSAEWVGLPMWIYAPAHSKPCCLFCRRQKGGKLWGLMIVESPGHCLGSWLTIDLWGFLRASVELFSRITIVQKRAYRSSCPYWGPHLCCVELGCSIPTLPSMGFMGFPPRADALQSTRTRHVVDTA